ncbi:molybdenum cofactor guanylyltransferase [Mastigocoleus sp. MO_188.B34]|uniref:molybdenum cofactor guanylyltransferase n=1 Tax=Mastigocoleus sp. MO_188.B34 TaxID=3036635 RepID=UPI0026292AB4|nr:molybdenum cofactor guanylyltransferase [Mastigocoleus sp. MO_188.B34]MDJ0697852.1 molybdenum cofactor guanylyltransferase [Mastigocoleus sp. MO_188.B34]
MTATFHSNIDLAALILAGGQSSRMGEDKALISYNGVPILQRVYQVATACTENIYVLSPWNERYQQILSPECKYLIESQPGRGPLFGFAEGLSQIPNDWILLLACDLPLLKVEVLQGWIERLPQLPSSISALAPQRSEIWEPMCAFYRREVLAELQGFLQTGGRSFQKWFSHICVEALHVDSEINLMLYNCNTPLDLEEIVNKHRPNPPKP